MISLGQIAGPPSDTLGLGLGVAAVVLVAGWTLTRWQRDRLRFHLMRTALERGVTRFPGTPPYWLLSLRQGVTLMALGSGLGIAGSAAWWLARGVEMPKSPAARVEMPQALPPSQHSAREIREPNRPPPPRPPRQEDNFRPPGGPPQGLPDEENTGRINPPQPADPERSRRNGDGPPGENTRQPHGEGGPHDPAMEKWHRAEAQQTIGLASVGAGFILVMLGIVRIGFAKVERRFASESDDPAVY